MLFRSRYLDGELRLCEAHGSAHDFGYRHSAFSDTDCVLLGSTLALTPGDPADIQARMRDLSERRRSRQPLDLPSAGSTFKRPVGGYAAALIDQAGLKGYTVGGAQVSESTRALSSTAAAPRLTMCCGLWTMSAARCCARPAWSLSRK